ncbi:MULTISPECIES: sensor histidine kinase [unclassified Coleofasciculus]|uniref:sensor histidine kinase n=1 Tax=unclassified Coleofasciculus TaxID=2692782 RepID=UPI00187F30B1|nr:MULTISPECIES: HAMP domain-containing sensor histidine kinase [unclassified Coleofasciculus]MBE9126664.1 HAMP domain-containing histidine kinase [Coleofasciculus sp. LEGE 07081]MBE9148506.1 HAMP domain-containing histidine kinase [Coleofasciculus sp. LEGE 07092]
MKTGLRRTKSLPLVSRLFFSHLLVMIAGVSSFVMISKLSSPRFFIWHLQRLEGSGFSLVYARPYLVKGFQAAWNRSTLWSVLVGATAAGGLSYWVSQRIVQPLTQIEQVTKKFAAGQLDERLPPSDIPEINQLAISFNRMAVSLEDVEQRRRELVSDLTHELRTPLTVLRGYLEELAAERIEPTPEVYQRLAKETRRLERLIGDLQELSKAEAGYLPIKLVSVNLCPLLDSLVQKFSDQLLEEGPELRLECPDELPPVLADIDRVEQVLVNLIGNAITYTQTGSIIVRAWTELAGESDRIPRLWISVTDTGVGIAPADLPHVFERFWRAEKSRNQNTGGTGIGLAISKRLIELQGGEIEVESQLGVGSTFRFYLPLG